MIATPIFNGVCNSSLRLPFRSISYRLTYFTAYIFETVKTETKNIHRIPSIPETLAVTATTLAAPAISQIQHSVKEMQKSVTTDTNNDNSRSSEEGYSVSCM